MAGPASRLLFAAALTLLLLAPLSSGGPAQAAGPERAPGARVELRANGAAAGTRVAAARRRSPQAATFVVNYDDAFEANQAARAAFQYAVDIWAGQIGSPVPIVVEAHWSELGPGLLGYAGFAYSVRDFAGAPQPGTYYPAAIANRLAGYDVYPHDADIEASFSSGANWYFGTDGHTPNGKYDFVTVVLHELGHGLGFAGSGAISSGVGYYGSGTQNTPYVWDRFVVNGGGQPLLSMLNNTPALALQLTGASLYFSGRNATAANGGGRPRLYAPPSWEQGSSYSHLDEATYPAGNPNSLMTPQLGSAEAIHDPGPIVRGMLTDMGWTTPAAAAPTPTPTRTPRPTAAAPTQVPPASPPHGSSQLRVLIPAAARNS